MSIRVAINGYGTIGKRVADAVTKQDDMEIVGVTKTRPTIEAFTALEKGFPFYAVSADHVEGFKAAGIEPKGTLEDLLKVCDVVVDCAPGKKGAFNLDTYKKAGVKAIFQGGEKHDTTGCSFNALSNYGDSIGKQFVRVVSCNTTGLTRTLYPLVQEIGIEEVQATMIRRSADPGDSKKGPINAIEPVLKVPSHHGPDVKTVIPGLNIYTLAVKVPTTIMHLHSIVVTLGRKSTTEEVLELWRKTPRVMLFNSAQGFNGTAQIMEHARDMGRSRSDLFEIAVWEDGVKVDGNKLYYYQAIHQESDVIPDNVDCIRAMMGAEKDNMASIRKTDAAMGIVNPQ